MEIHRLEIARAENGCVVNCSFREEAKGEEYEKYDSKTYTGSPDLMDRILSELSDEFGVKKKSVKTAWGG